MKYLFLILLAFPSVHADEQSLDQRYFEKLNDLRAEYRQAFALEIAKADKVVISIFDPALAKEKEVDPFQESPEPTRGLPSPKTLDENERNILLPLLAKQISDPDDWEMAMCHNPIHKIEIYSKHELIFESTLCWECQNFTFEYPEGSTHQPTSEALKEIFIKLMPIPESK